MSPANKHRSSVFADIIDAPVPVDSEYDEKQPTTIRSYLKRGLIDYENNREEWHPIGKKIEQKLVEIEEKNLTSIY